jgi:transcriptional regulator with XRE-family HTH domain
MDNRHISHTDFSQPDFTAFEAAVRDRVPQRTTVPTAALEGVARLGRLVQTLRAKQHWSLQALAAQSGLSWLWLALLEQGMLLPTELTPEVVQKLGQAFPARHAVAQPDVLFHTLVEDLLHLQVPAPEPEQPLSQAEVTRPTLRDHVEGLVRWVSERCVPQLAGVMPTAADIPPEDKTFYLDEGTIHVTFQWWPAAPGRPAGLLLQWRADLLAGNLWAQFTRRDDEAVVLAEVPLGSALADEAVFSAQELGFDPTREPWGVTFQIRETEP